MIERYTSLLNRISFAAALLLLTLSVILWFLRLIGLDISWISYAPGRLFEFSGIFLLLVIALLLRQIREAIYKGGAD